MKKMTLSALAAAGLLASLATARTQLTSGATAAQISRSASLSSRLPRLARQPQGFAHDLGLGCRAGHLVG